MTKRINKILWHGTEVPQASSKADGLDGLNEGELFIKNDPEEPGIFIRTTDSKVVKVGDSGIKLLNRLFTAFDANGNQVAFDDFSTTIASIRANYGLWTEYFLSAKGRNPSTGSSSGGDGASTLGGLNNVADGADVGEEGYDVAKMLVLEAKSNLWTLKNLSELVGLDEDALLAYLTENNYAKKSDIPSLDGYATESWVLGKGYATTSDLDARIDALVNGAPAAYDTLKEIADVLGKNVDSIADILDALGTKANKVDVDAAISAVNASISALNTELSGKIDLKLDAATFNELFEKVLLEDGKTYAIRAKLGLFSDSFLSAKGANSSGGSSTGGAGALYQLADVAADGQQVSGAAKGALLMYNGTQWQGVAQSEIVPNLTGYAKLTDIPTTFAWDKVTGKPATLSGYGITDAYTSSQIDTKLGGYLPLSGGTIGGVVTLSGNNVTNVPLNILTPSMGYTGYIRFGANSSTNELGHIGFSAKGVASILYDGTKYDLIHSGNIGSQSVASADKLTTARTIWGQSFDGTGDVNGVLTLNYRSTTRATGIEVISTNGGEASIGFNLNSSTRAVVGCYANALNLWREDCGTCMTIPQSGNVLIGTTTDSGYKLDVVGDARVSRLVIGDGVIEWDSENKGFKIVGGLYTESYLSAKGANSSGSSSSGGQYTRLDEWTNYSSAYDTWVLSAKLGKGLYDTQNSLLTRVGALEGKATNVSFTQSLTSGTQIGTITIDGASKTIYSPTIPTSLKNPNALTFGTKTYDGSAAKTIVASDLGALTAHQTIYALTIKNSAGTTQLTYTPNSAVGSLTLTKAMVGLGNVENTALSTWEGTSKITTLGTITSGTWNGTKIANSYLANSAITIAGTSVSLGSSITATTLQSNLGLGALAYKGSLSFAELTGKPATISGYGITDAIGQHIDVSQTLDANSVQNNHITHGSKWSNVPVNTISSLLDLSYSNDWRFQLLAQVSGRKLYTRFFYDGYIWSDWAELVTSLNYTNYSYSKSTIDTKLGGYLPLSGGTLSSYNFNTLHINSNDSSIKRSAIVFEYNKVTKTQIGWDEYQGMGSYLYNYASSVFLGIKDDGTPYYYNGAYNTIIHSGNIGSQSVASANRLLSPYTYEHSTLISNDTTSETLLPESYAFSAMMSGSPWSAYGFASVFTFSGYRQYGGSQIALQYNSTIARMAIRNYNQSLSGWNDWHEVAFLDSNVASATKLQTARSIWGQSFDGTGDVSGALSNVGNINFGANSTYNIGSNTNQVLYIYARWIGSQTNSPFGIGAAGAYHLSILTNGDVGIGTTSPQYKLDVRGVIYSNTGIFSDGYVSAKGQNTSSDMRLKNVLNDVVLNVSDIANAPSIRFAWKNGGGIDVGSSAQYWRGVLPDAVKGRDELEMQYGNIALLSAIAIAKRMETHEERIERLEREVKELRIENVELKNKIGGIYGE